MKKGFISVVSAIALLTISGCSCQGAGRARHYNSEQAEEKAQEYTSYKSYKLERVINLKGEATFNDNKTVGFGTLKQTLKADIENENVLVYQRESIGYSYEEYKLSDVIANGEGKTLDQLKEAYPKFTFDEAKGIVYREVSLNDPTTTPEKLYYVYDTEYKQYTEITWSNNKVVEAEYCDYDDYDNVQDDYFIIKDLEEPIKELLTKGAIKGNEYIITPGSGVDYGDLNFKSLSFKHDGKSMVLKGEVSDVSLGTDSKLDATIDVKFTELNKTKVTAPIAEIKCEHNHAFVKYDDCGELGHRKICQDCNKYVDAEISNHALVSGFGYCFDCDHGPDYKYNQCPAELINKDGHKLVLLQYSEEYNHYYAYSASANYDDDHAPLFKASFNLSDSHGNSYAMYYEEDKVLIISYQATEYEFVADNSCLVKTTYRFIAFKDVTLTLTPEQQAIIDNESSATYQKNNAYLNALGISTMSANTIADIKTGKTLLKEFDAYYFTTNHTTAGQEPVVISSCLTSTPYVCSRCGQTSYYTDAYSHERVISMINKPSWGDDDHFYFQYGDCAKCHKHDESIYVVEKTSYNLQYHYQDSYSIYANQYDADGNNLHSSESMYILNHFDKDGECVLCHGKVVTVNGISVHINSSGLAETIGYGDDTPYWKYGDSRYESETQTYVQEYTKGDITIIVRTKYDTDSTTYTVTYNGVTSSPVVFNNN